MSKKVSVKPQTNLFKTFLLLGLVIFTFYFIYNYLATGSFSLKPKAAAVVDQTGGIGSCSALLNAVDCAKVSGCSPVTTKQTSKTITTPVVTVLNCEESDCASGNFGCHYTKISKTVIQKQVQPVYECDDGSGVSKTKCLAQGGSWIKSIGTVTVNVPVTTTINDCRGTYSRTINKTSTEVVPEKFECIGTPSSNSFSNGTPDKGLNSPLNISTAAVSSGDICNKKYLFGAHEVVYPANSCGPNEFDVPSLSKYMCPPENPNCSILSKKKTVVKCCIGNAALSTLKGACAGSVTTVNTTLISSDTIQQDLDKLKTNGLLDLATLNDWTKKKSWNKLIYSTFSSFDTSNGICLKTSKKCNDHLLSSVKDVNSANVSTTAGKCDYSGPGKQDGRCCL